MEVAFSGSRYSKRSAGCWKPSQQPAQWAVAGRARASRWDVMWELVARKHHAGPGPQRQQQPSGSFWDPGDQRLCPESDGHVLSLAGVGSEAQLRVGQEEVSGWLLGQVGGRPGPASQSGSLQAFLYIAVQRNNGKNSTKYLGCIRKAGGCF